jgi:hypothetical protein
VAVFNVEAGWVEYFAALRLGVDFRHTWADVPAIKLQALGPRLLYRRRDAALLNGLLLKASL